MIQEPHWHHGSNRQQAKDHGHRLRYHTRPSSLVVACVWFGALCSGLLWVIEVSEKGWCTFLTDSKRFITSLIAVDRVLDAVAVEARREWNQRKLQRNARRNGRRARLGRACERGASRQRVRRRTGARTHRSHDARDEPMAGLGPGSRRRAPQAFSARAFNIWASKVPRPQTDKV